MRLRRKCRSHSKANKMPASNTLLREAIPTDISQGVAPVWETNQQGNIIHIHKISSENFENAEITKFLGNLLRSENLSGAAMPDPTREEFDAKLVDKI
jgi:hypothetical protein